MSADPAGAGKGVKHPRVGSYQGEVTQASLPFTGFARLQVFRPKQKGGSHRVLVREATAVVACTGGFGFPFVEATGETDMAMISDKGGFVGSGEKLRIYPEGTTDLSTLEVRGKFVSKRVATGTVTISYTQNYHPGLPCYQQEGTAGPLPFRVTRGPHQPAPE